MTLHPLHAPLLAQQPGIAHGFFTREGGVSTGIYASLNLGLGSADDRARVLENRALVADYFGVGAERLLSLYQIHSDRVVTVDTTWPAEPDAMPQADAMATRERNIVLGVLTADCAPILLADARAGVIGAAHSGWKGAIAQIGLRTVEAMERLGASREHIVAAIGPCIQQASYEVDGAFRNRFCDHAAENAAFFVDSPTRHTHHHFDLPGYVRHTLTKAGVGQVNLLANDTCLEQNAFFSYRRKTLSGEEDYGRQISAIMLRDA